MQHADDAPVLRHDADGVATLTLNRPERFNILSEEMLEALTDALASLADDPSLRCVVIAARGRAFCAGHDLRQMRARPDEAYYRDLFSRCGALMQAIVALPVPVIARVQGLATAAGCQLVASCDLAVAARSARFAVSGIEVGLFCSTPAVALSRDIGRKRALEMLFTGEFIDADQARDWGLVNRVADDARLDEVLASLTATLCAKSAVALRTGKAMFQRQQEMPLSRAYDYAGEMMATNMMAEDVDEGIAAFLAKRRPQWRHR
ncbi:enoyl-CoA hydratase [Halomonas nitroreducens]|uniref:Enoyl-CoA hydratase domain-containing protein 3, mitochondrial n=1 Tax=Halomonas nitroreducens TaxID=447425 RepID=A0A3S0KSE0_9GAMM|nr:enoyl-CoA hydratase [Halomonas nitroreducens]RTR05604.1 enoyl-CoA hydratase [Halomonas nitroreducens]